MSEIDLHQFCSTDKNRPKLVSPFSRNEYTYATNGHIIVRVPRRDDIQETADAPNPTTLFDDAEPRMDYRPAIFPELPSYKSTKIECFRCEGRGTEHDYPDCTCECIECGGDGFDEKEPAIYIGIDGVPFALKYVIKIASLPNIQVGKAVPSGALPFRFDGGEGLLMPVHANVGDIKVTTR